MTKHRLLLVEDEPAIREMVGMALSRAGYEVAEAATVVDARHAIANGRPDLVLLDWMLPDVSGIDFARELRSQERTRELPIIMLTARGEEADKVRGLEVGADDYVSKPFSTKELVARIRAVLRRTTQHTEADTIDVDGLRLDVAGHRVLVDDHVVNVGPTEYRLLHFFVTHPERVYSRGQLLDRVWGSNVYVEERTVDVHIRRLRKALSPSGHDRLVQTVRGAGYRFSQRV